MAMFVHLALAKNEAAIRRAGIRRGKTLFGGKVRDPIVYAFPVLPSHTLTHQWTREVLKWRRQPLIGVYFRVPDDEQVEFGHFGQELIPVTAARAVAALQLVSDPRGFEVVLRRPIAAREIHRIAPVRGVIGWRHMPDAHDRKPCGCPACVARGEPNSRKLRAAYEKDMR